MLRELANDTGESALLTRVRLPDVSEVLVQEDADRLLGATDWVGRTFDAHRSVAGWIVAAELDDGDVRRDGWRRPRDARALGSRMSPRRDRGATAVDVGGLEAGLTSIAVIVPGRLSGWRSGWPGPRRD